MALLKYSLLRLGVFAVVFFLCLNLNLGQFTALFALVIGLIVSWAVAYLFFNRLRLAAGQQLANRPRRTRRSAAEQQDNADEDDLADQYHEDTDPQSNP